MTGLLTKIIQNSEAEHWLNDRSLGWILDERIASSVDVVISSLIIYYIGKTIIRRGTKRLVRGTGRQKSWRRRDTEKREETLVQLGLSIWKIAIAAYLVATILQLLFNVNLSPLLASAGILGVALGFGAQSLIKDFISGIFIIAENQYRVGDIIEIGDAEGTVERIGTRTTVMRDREGSVHYLPNGTIQHVVNKTMGYGISRLVINVATSTDISEVSALIEQVGEKLAQEKAWQSKVIEAPRFASVGNISGSSIEIIITGKTQPSDQWAVTSEMRSRLLRAFQKHNITLAD